MANKHPRLRDSKSKSRQKKKRGRKKNKSRAEQEPRSAHGRAVKNGSHMGGKELNNSYIMLFALNEPVGALSAGGPVRVGLCRDSAPRKGEGDRGEQRRGSVLLKLSLFFFVVI